MSGGNGSGKSTLARAVGTATGAVVLDHDTTKTAVLAAGVPHPPAGNASYEVIFGLVEDLLAQGHSVIIDSPSVYEVIPRRGMTLAAVAGAAYYFVECACAIDIADRRMEARVRRPSQVDGVTGAAAIRASTTRVPHRPSNGTFVVDTTRPLGDCVADVLAYLDGSGASGQSVPANA
ncbi:MAG: hypothetical protein QOI61_2530 [Actinomycetota bacterium]|jgi:predicted kinase